MDIKLVPNALIRVESGLKKYQKIIGKLHSVNVAQNQEFQREYNVFFRMRQRKPEFYTDYYQFMELHKNDSLSDLSFQTVLYHFYDSFGRIEASFSSKLLSIINPDMPVWDKYVLENLGLKVPSCTASGRLEKIVILYDQICTWYQSFMTTEDAHKMILLFDDAYPDAGITDVKKIDLILWQIRD